MGFIEELKNLDACKEGIEWASTQPSAQEMWEACHRGDWMLWLCGKLSGVVGSNSRKKLVYTLCKCVRLVLPYGNDTSRIAIETAKSYCEGRATLEEVRSTAYAACTTDAVTYAAYTAAYVTYAANAAYAAAKAATYTTYAANEQEWVLKQCADIVREYYPVCPLTERS